MRALFIHEVQTYVRKVYDGLDETFECCFIFDHIIYIYTARSNFSRADLDRSAYC